MIETEKNKLDMFRERQPFRIPDGYFDGFTEEFMNRLPNRPKSAEAKVITLYDRLMPWLYLAASFIGIIILFNIFSKDKDVVMIEDNSVPDAIVLSESAFEAEDLDADFLEYMKELYIDQMSLAAIMDDYWDN
jgi:hypothetical protein